MTTTDILFETHGRVGLARLNRPQALNALTRDMCAALDRQLGLWAKDDGIASVVIVGEGPRAFCAGGDVRAVWEAGHKGKGGFDGHPHGSQMAREFFRDEYRMNHTIGTYPKPYIALLNGITMGGGVGISIHGAIRIAVADTLFAMPECAIGFFPDVGGTYALPRLPERLGFYCGLTGARLKGPAIAAVGVATHYAESLTLDTLLAALSGAADAKAVHAAIDKLAHRVDIAESGLPLDVIARCFAAGRVEDILTALEAEKGDFAAETLATLKTQSPLSLKITLAALLIGGRLSLREALAMEYRLSQAFMAGETFYEGIRAQLVDKDRQPRWQPATLAGVDEATVMGHLGFPVDLWADAPAKAA